MIVFLSMAFVIGYYFIHTINQCIKNPLRYAADEYSKEYGVNFEGLGYFDGLYTNNYIYFNRTGIYSESSPLS